MGTPRTLQPLPTHYFLISSLTNLAFIVEVELHVLLWKITEQSAALSLAAVILQGAPLAPSPHTTAPHVLIIAACATVSGHKEGDTLLGATRIFKRAQAPGPELTESE